MMSGISGTITDSKSVADVSCRNQQQFRGGRGEGGIHEVGVFRDHHLSLPVGDVVDLLVRCLVVLGKSRVWIASPGRDQPCGHPPRRWASTRKFMTLPNEGDESRDRWHRRDSQEVISLQILIVRELSIVMPG